MARFFMLVLNERDIPPVSVVVILDARLIVRLRFSHGHIDVYLYKI
jgi:hypothetical protein